MNSEPEINELTIKVVRGPKQVAREKLKPYGIASIVYKEA